MAILGYLPKLKRGLRLAFGAHFLHDSSIEVFLISYSINKKTFLDLIKKFLIVFEGLSLGEKLKFYKK